MTDFRYVDFYEFPRTIVLRVRNRWFLLPSAFNDELDEYENEYFIYPLPDSFEPVQSGTPWKFLEELELKCIAKVPVKSVQFDGTKRRKRSKSSM
jgi:translation initiation factor 2 beta subunit (eIF-2beta)/eIF-5